MAGPSQLSLALWLLRREASDSNEPDAVLAAAERSLQKLCARVAKLMTAAGCQSLVARAIHLACAEAPFLRSVRAGIPPAACLEGVDEAARGTISEQTQAGFVAVMAHLIALLEVFIGDDVTTRLIRDVWPDAPRSPDGSDTWYRRHGLERHGPRT